MADVTLSYKGSDILELSDSGSATLKTGGKYCEADIEVEYVKPSGGGGFPLSGVTITSGNFMVASAVGGTISINHGLSKTPFMVIVMPTENALISANRNLGGVGVACKMAVDNKFYAGARFYSNNNNPAYTHNPNNEPNSSPDTTYIHGFTSTKFDVTASSSFPFIVAEYQWIAFAFKEA